VTVIWPFLRKSTPLFAGVLWTKTAGFGMSMLFRGFAEGPPADERTHMFLFPPEKPYALLIHFLLILRACPHFAGWVLVCR
jgi:hypothetical protein